MSKRDRIKEISVEAGGVILELEEPSNSSNKVARRSKKEKQWRLEKKKRTKSLENCHQETFEMKAHPYQEAKPQSNKKINPATPLYLEYSHN